MPVSRGRHVEREDMRSLQVGGFCIKNGRVMPPLRVLPVLSLLSAAELLHRRTAGQAPGAQGLRGRLLAQPQRRRRLSGLRTRYLHLPRVCPPLTFRCRLGSAQRPHVPGSARGLARLLDFSRRLTLSVAASLRALESPPCAFFGGCEV